MIITNNKMVYSVYKDTLNVLYVEGGFLDVLIKTRDRIHVGYELLTHPLSSSVKPNETPYKSIIISDSKGNINIESINIIENSIMTYTKFKDYKYKQLNDKLKNDFQLIDLTVLQSALNK